MKIAFFGDSLTEGNFGVSFMESLKRKLPDDELLNYGEGGETVISLYHRIAGMQPLEHADLAVIWIGVNDVFGQMTLLYRIINKIRRKPSSSHRSEFKDFYRAIVDLLFPCYRKIFTIPPLFLGEDLVNVWNRRLEGLSTDIQEISNEHEDVEFINLRDSFIPELGGRQGSSYLPKSVFQFLRDKSDCTTIEEVDRRSAERGLYFTLDGVHLNSKGADIVANSLEGTIEDFRLTT